MIPQRINFYVYIETESDAVELETALHDFVNSKREQGIAVTANALKTALNRFKDNFFVNQFLKQNGRK
jgi:hypothetical protein